MPYAMSVEQAAKAIRQFLPLVLQADVLDGAQGRITLRRDHRQAGESGEDKRNPTNGSAATSR